MDGNHNRPLSLLEGLRGLANHEHGDVTFAEWAASELEAMTAQRDEAIAVCREIARLSDKWGDQGPLVQMARAAIAKAEGK